MTRVLYRYDQTLIGHGGHDEVGEWRHSHTEVEVDMYQYPVVKETPKGVWVNVRYSYYPGMEFSRYDCKWVSNTTRKRFAYPTPEEALSSFKYRKQRQISILKVQLRNAERAYAIADGIKQP